MSNLGSRPAQEENNFYIIKNSLFVYLIKLFILIFILSMLLCFRLECIYGL